MTDAWSVGGSLITARYIHFGFGSDQANLIGAGDKGFGGSQDYYLTSTEEYNGTSWSSSSSISLGRDLCGGTGTSTAGLITGGDTSSEYAVNSTEEYNGTSWSSGGNLNTGRMEHANSGTLTSGLAIAGIDTDDNTLNSSEEYDGTTWSVGGNLNNLRQYLGSGGNSLSSSIAIAGVYSTIMSSTEEYDSTTWSAGGSLNTARKNIPTGPSGMLSSCFTFGGYNTSSLSSTEHYNGTSWSSRSSLNTGRYWLSGGGREGDTALAVGGLSSGSNILSSTEEYNSDAPLTGLRLFNSSLGLLNISDVLTWVEKPNIQYQIKRYPNQSVFIQVKQNPMLNYNLTLQIDNNSTKDQIYGFLGYRMDYMSYGNVSHAKIWITEYHPTRKQGVDAKWIADIKIIKET